MSFRSVLGCLPRVTIRSTATVNKTSAAVNSGTHDARGCAYLLICEGRIGLRRRSCGSMETECGFILEWPTEENFDVR